MREWTLLLEQRNVDGEIVAGQKTGRSRRTTPLWAALRDDLLAWQALCGRRRGLVFPNFTGKPGARPTGGAGRSAFIREGASIPELAEELGHSPLMTLGTYTHVINELRRAPRLPAEEEIAKARARVEHGLRGPSKTP